VNLNTLSQLIYDELMLCDMGSDQNYFNILSELRNTLIKNGDPLIIAKISNTNLLMNISHNMALHAAHTPLCGTVLPRIAKTIFQQDKHLKVIDIGANIGDSVASIFKEVPSSFLCVEGDKNYFSLLQQNIKSMNAQAVCVNAVCGEGDCQVPGYMSTEYGTSHFVAEKDRETISITSLKTILENNTFFKDANLIKVDTDGFDSYVLRGAREFLAEAAPTVFFEFAPVLLQNPLDIFPYLVELGYRHSLFYALDYPLEIVDIGDQQKLAEMVADLDNRNVGFYDILLPGRSISCESFITFYQNEAKAVQKILASSEVR
jgi:FkbM family methyltransferase